MQGKRLFLCRGSQVDCFHPDRVITPGLLRAGSSAGRSCKEATCLFPQPDARINWWDSQTDCDYRIWWAWEEEKVLTASTYKGIRRNLRGSKKTGKKLLWRRGLFVLESWFIWISATSSLWSVCNAWEWILGVLLNLTFGMLILLKS